MTQPATAATVRAPFAGESLLSADDGRTYRLRRDGDALWADISGVGARRIPMLTGSHHMQAFWLAGAQPNELIEFPFTYLFDDARWVPRRDVFLVGTEYSKQPSELEPHLHRVSRHRRRAGPRRAHRRAHEPRRRARHRLRGVPRAGGGAPRRQRRSVRGAGRCTRGGADGTIVNPARLPPARSAEVCGQCHGIGCPPERLAARRPRLPPRASRCADGKPILRLASLGTEQLPPPRSPPTPRSPPAATGATAWCACRAASTTASSSRAARSGARSPACPATRCTTAIPTGSSPRERDGNAPARGCHARHRRQRRRRTRTIAPARRDRRVTTAICRTRRGACCARCAATRSRARACRTTSTRGGRTRATCAISIARSAGRPRR